MKEWEYTFDGVTKAEWIRQITSDLRQKPLESLAGEWWEGEVRHPVLHREDVLDEIVRLPDYLFNEAPLIMEDVVISLTQPGKVNKHILDALQQGIQSVLFHMPSTETSFNNDWIENVHLDWITFQLEPDKLTYASLIPFLQRMPEHTRFRMVRTVSSDSLASLLPPKDQPTGDVLNDIRFVYRLPSSGKWTENTSAIFNLILDDLNQWKSLGFESDVFLKQCILWIEADQDYFKQILQTRVLHVLWQNLYQHIQNGTIDPANNYLETHILQKANEKPEHFLIRASMSALAASLSGTRALCIHHVHGEGYPSFFQRINRNIHHLLDLESAMYKGSDPLAGAYSLDYPTKQWATMIWDNIFPENKGGRLDV